MNAKKERRQRRIRSKIKEGVKMPRVTVFRSNKYIAAQIIDDQTGKTIVGLSEIKLDKKEGTKSEKAKMLGLKLAALAKAKKITKIAFDRGSYSYHGRVKMVAEGLREGGLDF